MPRRVETIRESAGSADAMLRRTASTRPSAPPPRCNLRVGARGLLLAAALGSCAHRPKGPTTDERELLRSVVVSEVELGGGGGDAAVAAAVPSEFAPARARALRAAARKDAAGARDLFLDRLQRDEVSAVRREAAYALGAFEDERSAQVLEQVTSDQDPTVRSEAVRALGRRGALRLESVERLLDDVDPLVRRSVCVALAFPRAPGAGSADLGTVLRSRIAVEEDERVRWAIVASLGAVDAASEESRGAFTRGLEDKNFLVRAYSFWALGKGAPAGVDDAMKILDASESPAVLRSAARSALRAWAHRGALGSDILPRVAAFPEPALSLIVQAPPEASVEMARVDLGALLPSSLRNPRAWLRVEGRGDILLELLSWDAPRHVAAFIERAQRGEYSGRRIRVDPDPDFRLAGCLVADTCPEGAVAEAPGPRLPLEAFPTWFGTGTVISPGEAAGGVFISRLPIPHLDGVATGWARVALGMEVLEIIEDGDRVESVTVVTPLGAPFPTRAGS
ncbi:MAG TPA: HEAT repeat domain-containing protein [Planctomycetota bacterium]|nr:HEAT repeat domain-containing protein [Planctomycetota bacterium]